MIHDILIYPDPRLHQVSQEVTEFGESLHTLLDDMYETMIARNGVGLAAIQIGIAQRALIINIPLEGEEGDDDLVQLPENTLEVINPVITDLSDEMVKFQEGCLSVPGFYEDIERHAAIKLTYQDRHGEHHVIEDDGFLAIALQHETDHLEGKLFIEKLSYTKRKKFEKEWRKKKKR